MNKMIMKVVSLTAMVALFIPLACITREVFVAAFVWAVEKRLTGGESIVLFAVVLGPLTVLAFFIIRWWKDL